MASGMNRRGFLRTAAAALAGPTILTRCATTGAPRPAPSERVTLGAIGLGWQGPDNLGQFLQRKDVQVVAVCDVDRNHLQRVKEMVDRTYDNADCAVYAHFEELLARGDLDAVSIALPDHWHAIPAIMAADAGLDVYGEKPLAHTLIEGRAICNAIKRNDRVWQTGSWQRSVENFHRAAELVRNGRIGKVSRVEVGLGQGYDDYAGTKDQTAEQPPPPELDYDKWLGPAPVSPYVPARIHKNWRWVMDYGGGRIMDWVGHHLDIAHWGLGLDHTGPVLVEGTGVIPRGGVWDAPTDYDCACTYAGGLTIEISSRFPMGTKWFGEDGWLFVTRGQLTAEPASVLDEFIGDDEIRLYKSRNHIGNFIECVKSRETTITPAETAHRSASVGHLCDIAIYTGRRIRWNPETEEILDDPGASEMLAPRYRAPWVLKT
ncbi:MAG TPA: Gfo/Idh/MocA family oxidoreductase [Candidatus Hydrogenedentes bacterium]|nr:Gfo/Idh/MocA family oxidoreductase [Candidatus Hydrogenedentota bacterium]